MSSSQSKNASHALKHPLAGQVRRLHTTFENLHGRPFLVVDWHSRMAELPGVTREQLRQDFIARCRTKCKRTVNEGMDWYFDSRVILGFLGSDNSGTPMLIDKDELPDLKQLMSDAYDSSVGLLSHCARDLGEALNRLERDRLSAKTASAVKVIVHRFDEISKLVTGDDLLFTEAGIAGLERASLLAADFHRDMVELQQNLLNIQAQRRRHYHQSNGWMRHYAYHDWVGGQPTGAYDGDREDGRSVLDKASTLCHQPRMNYSTYAGSTLCLVHALAFTKEARAFFDWLTAWEKGGS